MNYFKNLMTILLMTVLFFGISGNCFTKAEQINSTPNSFSTVNMDMEDYVALTRRRIKNNWYPPTDAFENAATIVLTIDKDGQLLNCRISAPSESKSFDDSLINAAKITKYAPLPKKYLGKTVDIDLDFNMQRRTISK